MVADGRFREGEGRKSRLVEDVAHFIEDAEEISV